MNDYQFAMYNPDADTITVSAGSGQVLVIRCKEFNSTVILDNPDDITTTC